MTPQESRSSSQIGVKRLLSENFSCTFFNSNPQVWDSSFKKHEKLVGEVMELFEKSLKKPKCITEYPLTLDDTIKGKADIVCEDADGYVYIVEVKSTQIHRVRFQDLLQLMLYVYMYSMNKGVPLDRIKAYLVYRYVNIRELKVSPYIIHITGDIKRTLLNIVQYIADRQKTVSSGINKTGNRSLYIVTDLCKICINNNCPFKAS